jgi:regulator of protease activity HflC (stomatin/prohibitin superfamily)
VGREGDAGRSQASGSGRTDDPRPFLQAEAERERRAKIIHAEGEYTAAEKLAMAAEVIQKQPVAIQLRHLQTLVEIGAEKNTTIIFPFPVDMINSLGRFLDRSSHDSTARPQQYK